MAGEKILLVEYDPRTMKETKDILMKAGFIVVEAADGLAALAIFEESKPDLILMSPMLPKLHGFDVCQKIKSSTAGKSSPVVIITDVYKGRKYRMDALHLYKADEYIEKPITDEELIKILNNLLIKFNKIKKEGKEFVQEKSIEIDSAKLPFAINETMKEVKEEAKAKKREEKVAKAPIKEPEAVSKPQAKKKSLDLDIEKKLSDTLSGLEINLPKFTQKKPTLGAKKEDTVPPKKEMLLKEGERVSKSITTQEKVKEPVISEPKKIETKEKKSIPGAEIKGDILTSEEIFQEVIKGVEEEVKKEEGPKAVIAAKKEKAASLFPKEGAKVETKPKEKVAEQVPLAKEGKGKALDDLEKKLSDTLAGISMELGIKVPPVMTAKEKKPQEKISPTKVAQPKEEAKVISEKEKIIEESLSQELPTIEEMQLSDIIDRLEEEKVEETQKESAGKIEDKKEIKEEVREDVSIKEVVMEEVPMQGIQFGDYILLEKIATGGMAELFKAKKKGVEGFEKLVAIKRILPHLCDNDEFIKMFIDEAKLAAQLSHPNIVQIYELGKVNSNLFIAMELVEGKDLRALLKKIKEAGRLIPMPIVLHIGSRLCAALDYAHRMKNPQGEFMNIVHRDVSPQNIIISYEGEVKLVDFGIAKAAVKAHQTQTGALKGKLLYMSPEQASAKYIDRRSDIFALGVILWEMLTNKPLFYEKGDSEVSIIEKVRKAIVPDIKTLRLGIPDEFKRILMKALQLDPAKRYQNASEMQIDIDSLLHKMHIQVSQTTLAGYVSALFSDDEFRLDEIERQLEPQIPETKIITPEEKPIEVKKVAPEPIREVLIKPPIREQVEKSTTPKPFARMESFKSSIEEEKKKSYLTYVIPILIGLIVIVVILFNVFKGGEQTTQQQGKLELAKEATLPQPTMKEAELGREANIPEDITEGTKSKQDMQPKQPSQEKPIIKETPEVKIENKAPEKEKAPPEEAPPKITEPKKEESIKVEEANNVGQKITQPKEILPPKESPPVVEPKIEEKPTIEPPKVLPTPTPAPSESKVEKKQIEEPQIKEGDLVEVSPDVVMPVLIKRVLPKYPPLAQKTKVEGLVIIQALISEKGDVLAVKVLRAPELLSDAAKEAVLKWKFTPATKNGVKVKIWHTITIPFKLK